MEWPVADNIHILTLYDTEDIYSQLYNQNDNDTYAINEGVVDSSLQFLIYLHDFFNSDINFTISVSSTDYFVVSYTYVIA